MPNAVGWSLLTEPTRLLGRPHSFSALPGLYAFALASLPHPFFCTDIFTGGVRPGPRGHRAGSPSSVPGSCQSRPRARSRPGRERDVTRSPPLPHFVPLLQPSPRPGSVAQFTHARAPGTRRGFTPPSLRAALHSLLVLGHLLGSTQALHARRRFDSTPRRVARPPTLRVMFALHGLHGPGSRLEGLRLEGIHSGYKQLEGRPGFPKPKPGEAT